MEVLLEAGAVSYNTNSPDHDPLIAATRIILLTSGDHPADAARARELRIDAHLPDGSERALISVTRATVPDEPPPGLPASSW